MFLGTFVNFPVVRELKAHKHGENVTTVSVYVCVCLCTCDSAGFPLLDFVALRRLSQNLLTGSVSGRGQWCF